MRASGPPENETDLLSNVGDASAAYGHMPFSVLKDPALSWEAKLVFAFRQTFIGHWTLRMNGRWGLWDGNKLPSSLVGLGKHAARKGLNGYRLYKNLEQPRDASNRFVNWRERIDENVGVDKADAFIVRRRWFDGRVSGRAYYVLLHVAALTKLKGRAYKRELEAETSLSNDQIEGRLLTLVKFGFVERVEKDCFRLRSSQASDTRGRSEALVPTAEPGTGKAGTGADAKPGTGLSGHIHKAPQYENRPISKVTLFNTLYETTPHSTPDGEEGGGALSFRMYNNRFLGWWLDAERTIEFEELNILSSVRGAMADDEAIRLLRQTTRDRADPQLISQDGCDAVRVLASCILSAEGFFWKDSGCAPWIALGAVFQAMEDRVGSRGERMVSFGVVGQRIAAELPEYIGQTRFYSTNTTPNILYRVASRPVRDSVTDLLDYVRVDLLSEVWDVIEQRLRDKGIEALNPMYEEVQALKSAGYCGKLTADEVCQAIS